MIPTLRTLMLAGLGTLELTEEKLRGIFDDLVHRGEVTEKEARDLIATWAKHAAEHRQAHAREIRDIVAEELEKRNLPSRDEFDSLADDVRFLERKLPVQEVPVR